MRKVSCFLISYFCFFAAKADEYTPVGHQSSFETSHLEKKRLWKPTNYKRQKGVLGYSKKTFTVPVELRAQVDFWKEIYTKYSSQQGILHDSENIDLIYEVIDFSSVENNKRAKERLVRQKKEFYRKVLRSLQETKGLKPKTEIEKKIVKALSKDTRKNKYYLASLRGRLRFQLGQSDVFLKGVYDFGRYKEEIETIFRKHQIPLELTRLPFIESSYNILARSRLGASGIWQIMPRTGKQYMKVTRSVDERNHPILASEVAARILKKNYQLLESWPLAITGYNHGAYGLRKLVRKHNTNDYIHLILKGKRKRFGFASKNFYATFLAALEVESQVNRYFGRRTHYAVPLESHKISLDWPLNYKQMTSWFPGGKEQAQLFNPHLGKLVRQGSRLVPVRAEIYVPLERKKYVLDEMKKISSLAKSKTRLKKHRVAKGESLSLIARRYGVSLRQVLALNSIRNAHHIRVGQVVFVPKK